MGRAFSADLKRRAHHAVDHRISCGWFKFRGLQRTLTDHHVDTRLRFKLFDTVVTPTVLYSLETVPLTQALQRKLDVTQRCMLRRMLGWVCYSTDTFEERGRRMQQRLERALRASPVSDWSSQILKKEQMRNNIEQTPLWTKLACNWCPKICANLNANIPSRKVGRPATRW